MKATISYGKSGKGLITVSVEGLAEDAIEICDLLNWARRKLEENGRVEI